MFPYLTLHDATQTRNKNLLISHCYLTLELGTRLSLVTITRTSHRNTKLARESAFSASDVWRIPLYLLTGAIIMGLLTSPRCTRGPGDLYPGVLSWPDYLGPPSSLVTPGPDTDPRDQLCLHIICSALFQFTRHYQPSLTQRCLNIVVVVTQLIDVGVDHDCVLRMLWAGWAVLIS